MVTGVTIEFFDEPTEDDRHRMRLAALKLTKAPVSVSVDIYDDSPRSLIAIFKMKNEAQCKVPPEKAEHSKPT